METPLQEKKTRTHTHLNHGKTNKWKTETGIYINIIMVEINSIKAAALVIERVVIWPPDDDGLHVTNLRSSFKAQAKFNIINLSCV